MSDWKREMEPPKEGSRAGERVKKRGCVGETLDGAFSCEYGWGCGRCPAQPRTSLPGLRGVRRMLALKLISGEKRD